MCGCLPYTRTNHPSSFLASWGARSWSLVEAATREAEEVDMRLQEEEEQEREMKQLEVARYQQEMKLAQKEAEEEKIRRKQAYLK